MVKLTLYFFIEIIAFVYVNAKSEIQNWNGIKYLVVDAFEEKMLAFLNDMLHWISAMLRKKNCFS